MKRPELAQARASAIRAAYLKSRAGPWSVAQSTILPPDGDIRSYQSWAPYWHPDCSRCEASQSNDKDDHQPASNEKRSVLLTSRPPSAKHLIFSSHSSAPADLLVPAAPNMTEVGFEHPASNTAFGFARRPAATASKTKACPTLSSNAPPSATWTSCTYVQRDGRVNPDVRLLNDSSMINDVSQAAISLTVAYALTGDAAYATTASSFIDTFFIDPRTGMNPNVAYGQVVRGPGTQKGSFMAILDLRGLVKVVNAVEILRESGAPGWTWDRDSRLVDWATRYISWLQTSAQGQKAANAANNHGTFFAAQMAALQVLVGDLTGARQTLRNFFHGAFQDQLVASGEQPFEAIRTRPAHYRAFNIEGMIVCAKLADQLGLDAWSFGSKYGATIKTAVDFALSSYGRAADAATAPAELAPHVATVAAAYGDPTGLYAAWLKRTNPQYTAKTWYLWDQPESFAMSPRGHHKRSLLRMGECDDEALIWLASGLRERMKRTRRAGSRKLKGKGLTRVRV